ncbi:hypothetical protein M5K25_025970 [Dendrobium thyrsiflorum]|uniref:Uncharacterized protein n=1 Tax=Dendrobium thyrsiflorum TaxID=117978 RepID=A0ABD0TW91_DENTH
MVYPMKVHIKSSSRKREKTSLPFLACGVPNLRLDDLAIDIDAPSGELHPNGGLRLQTELVPRESREKVRFSDSRIPN